MREYSISVVVPVYNEILLLEDGIFKIDSFLKNNFDRYEIIIVESGSTDGSNGVCDALAEKLLRVKVIHQETRKGYGNALRAGFKAAEYDLIWPISVDLPFKLSTIITALPYFLKYDCVLSYRISDTRSVVRKVGASVYNLLVKLLLNVKVRHVNSAFKVFKRKVLKRFKVEANGWFFDAEFVCRLYQHKIDFVEIGVGLLDRRRGKSTVGGGAVVQTLLELWQFIFARRIR